jgi:hypothetical protein
MSLISGCAKQRLSSRAGNGRAFHGREQEADPFVYFRERLVLGSTYRDG